MVPVAGDLCDVAASLPVTQAEVPQLQRRLWEHSHLDVHCPRLGCTPRLLRPPPPLLPRALLPPPPSPALHRYAGSTRL